MHSAKLSSKNYGKIETFSDKQIHSDKLGTVYQQETVPKRPSEELTTAGTKWDQMQKGMISQERGNYVSKSKQLSTVEDSINSLTCGDKNKTILIKTHIRP